VGGWGLGGGGVGGGGGVVVLFGFGGLGGGGGGVAKKVLGSGHRPGTYHTRLAKFQGIVTKSGSIQDVFKRDTLFHLGRAHTELTYSSPHSGKSLAEV